MSGDVFRVFDRTGASEAVEAPVLDRLRAAGMLESLSPSILLRPDLTLDGALRPPAAKPAPFRVLSADPPWLFGDRLPASGRGASKFYSCMTIDQICAHPLPPIANDAALFLWRVAGGTGSDGKLWLPDRAFDVIRAWGFSYKTEHVWLKRTICPKCKGSGRVKARVHVEQLAIPRSVESKWVYSHPGVAICPGCDGRGMKRWFGMGRYGRGEHETVLIATRGKMVPKLKNIRTTFEAVVPKRNGDPKGTHSAKPDAFRARVESMFDGPYAELFARGAAPPGWTFFGHEAEAPADGA